MDPADLKARILFIRELLKKYNVALVPGEGLQSALDRAEAWADAAIGAAPGSRMASRQAADAAAVAYSLAETLEPCFRAGLPLGSHLSNIATGSTDHGVPADPATAAKKIYFKDFELELLVASRCIQLGMKPCLSAMPNDPLADLYVGRVAISVKHPDSFSRLERHIKKFNTTLRARNRFGVFVAGLEDAFEMGNAPLFPTEEDKERWLQEVRGRIVAFGSRFLEHAEKAERVLAAVQVATYPMVVAGSLTLARDGNAVLFDREVDAESDDARDALFVARAFNPEPVRWKTVGGRETGSSTHRLSIPPKQLAQYCQAHHIRRLSIFGSTLAGTARPDSDIDLLVEFEPGREPGLLALAAMEAELTDMLGGSRVDLRTAQDLGRHFRDRVLREAELQYAG
jgi:uncharacterized protein